MAVNFVEECIHLSTRSFSRLRMWARLQHKLRWLPHSRALRRAKIEMVGTKQTKRNFPGRNLCCTTILPSVLIYKTKIII